jgi:hypothetical protein
MLFFAVEKALAKKDWERKTEKSPQKIDQIEF